MYDEDCIVRILALQGRRSSMPDIYTQFLQASQRFKIISQIYEFEALSCTFSYIKEESRIYSHVALMIKNMKYVFTYKGTQALYSKQNL